MRFTIVLDVFNMGKILMYESTFEWHLMMNIIHEFNDIISIKH